MAEKQTSEESLHQKNEALSKQGEPRHNIGMYVTATAGIMLIGMIIYEWVSYLIRPTAQAWGLRSVTVVVASLLATVTTYVVLSRLQSRFKGIASKVVDSGRSEEKQRKAYAELERRMEDETTELIAANKQLRHQIDTYRQSEEELKRHNEKLSQELKERKQVKKELDKSEEKYLSILESIQDGYFEVDPAGNFTSCNRALCQSIGYSRDELLGMNYKHYTKGNSQKVYDAFNRVYTTEEPAKEFDWEIFRKDGSKRYVEASISIIKDEEGNKTGFRGIVRDITERKQAEEKMKSLLYSFGKVWTK